MLTNASQAVMYAVWKLSMVLAVSIPNPAPGAPPDLQDKASTLIALAKYVGLVCCVVGFVVCGAQMAIGRRRRSEMASEGVSGIPYVVGGVLVVVGAVSLVTGLASS